MSRAPRRHRGSRQSARRRHSVLGGRDFDHFACRRCRWNALTALPKVVDMEFDGVTDQRQRFITRVGRCNAPWKVGNVSAKRRRSFLNNNEIAHFRLLLLETRLLQDAIKGARRHVGSGIASNSNGTRFGRMVKLAMTPGDADLHPSVRLNLRNEFTDLHRQSLPSVTRRFRHTVTRLPRSTVSPGRYGTAWPDARHTKVASALRASSTASTSSSLL